jgi:hypothetical protein
MGSEPNFKLKVTLTNTSRKSLNVGDQSPVKTTDGVEGYDSDGDTAVKSEFCANDHGSRYNRAQ